MMAVLDWQDEMAVGVAFMDGDHAEAAAQINALAAATAAMRADLLAGFIDHCREHFAREEEMMTKTGFFALHCHRDEHTRVLAELDGVLARLRAGDAQDDYFARALPAWLTNHRNTMDFVTANFARQAGFGG